MALDHEVDALGVMQETAEQRRMRRYARRMRLLFEFSTVRAYRALLLDETGALRPEAVRVLADIGAKARLGVVDDPTLSDGALREFAGRRAIALHVLARADQSGVKLRDLARKLREVENE